MMWFHHLSGITSKQTEVLIVLFSRTDQTEYCNEETRLANNVLPSKHPVNDKPVWEVMEEAVINE